MEICCVVVFTYKSWRWDVFDMQSDGIFIDYLLEAELSNNASLEFACALPACGSANVGSEVSSCCSDISRKLVENARPHQWHPNEDWRNLQVYLTAQVYAFQWCQRAGSDAIVKHLTVCALDGRRLPFSTLKSTHYYRPIMKVAFTWYKTSVLSFIQKR